LSLVYLGLGSNHSPRLAYIKEAETLLVKYVGEIVKSSKNYKTEPWGNKDQEYFINKVCLIKTYHNPHILLSLIQKIEYIMGRVKREKWADRLIDIDILFYDDIVLDTEILQIPHPYFHQRLFTLEPMKEINHMFIHPLLQKTIEELYLACEDESAVSVLEK